MKRRLFNLTALLSVCLATLTPVAQAADVYPSKPIKMVIAFPPGGPTDVNSRLFAQAMSIQLGQPVIVENRPGAGGNLASTAVAGAPADGYTLLFNTTSFLLGPLTYNSARHDPFKDFVPVVRTTGVPMVLTVNPSVQARSVKELVALAKKEPTKINYASSGAGTLDHLGTAFIATLLDIKLEHVPYKGTAPALTDQVGGSTQMMVTTLNTVLPFIRDRRLVPLAILSRERSPPLPNLPTFSEATGIPNVEVIAWNGIMAPAGTPASVVARLNAVVNQVTGQESFQEKMRNAGNELYGGSSAEYGAYLASENKRFSELLQRSGVEKQ